MKLTVLGCGDAFGNGGRNNTSFLLSHHGEHVLMDCGASTLIRLKHEKVKLEDISTVIISHFHGDHYGGLPFLLISFLFEYRRNAPLTIVGPQGIKDRVYSLQEAMYAGTSEKLSELDLTFVEFKSGGSIIVSDKRITALSVEHSPPSNPHGYRLEWRGKKVAFSGDTSWTDNLIDLSANTDLFICECNFMNGVSFGHLSVEELKEKAGQFGCKQLWLTHMAEDVIDDKTASFNKLYDGLKLTF